MATAYPIVPGVAFKDIVGFPDYCVGDDGSVWGRVRATIKKSGANNGWQQLRPSVAINGYLRITLRNNGEKRMKTVSRLVLEAFVGPRPPGMQSCHFPDISRTNNRLENLRWDTDKNNKADQLIHGTRAWGSKNGQSRITESDLWKIHKLSSQGWTGMQIAEWLNVTPTVIGRILGGQAWQHAQAALDLKADA